MELYVFSIIGSEGTMWTNNNNEHTNGVYRVFQKENFNENVICEANDFRVNEWILKCIKTLQNMRIYSM